MKGPGSTPMDGACPVCRVPIGRFLSATGDAPVAGTITVCTRCAAVAVFDAAVGLRRPTLGELLACEEADRGERLASMIRSVRLTREAFRRAERPGTEATH